jgi:uncharacterized metal-binding protein
MPDLPEKKVGIIACSGEDLPCGTATREAALLVLERLRPQRTVTLCLPLFLAGEERERAFARFFPTIAVDGCDKRCAARATALYSAEPAASIVVDELQAQLGLPPARRVRGPDEARADLVQATAQAIAQEVDRLLANQPATVRAAQPESAGNEEPEEVTCSCGSDIPVQRIGVDGETFEVVALPAIFDLISGQGLSPEEEVTADALLEHTRIYNAIPAEKENALRQALLLAYRDFCVERGARGERR